MSFLSSLKQYVCPPSVPTPAPVTRAPQRQSMTSHRLPTMSENSEISTSTSSAKLTSPSAIAITIKLRNVHTSPPTTRTFSLPRSRLLQTSTYFRTQISNPSISKHKDGIIRLNFPDFEIFAIYAEWLRSGEIFSKAGLRSLQSREQNYDGRNRADSKEKKARDAYTDFLGCYFLGTWLQDITFKDMLVSLVIDRMNLPDDGGFPMQFVKCLKPSLVDLVCIGGGGEVGRGMRRLMYAAIARWGEEVDVERLVPTEGRTCERGFVRGLLGFLLAAQRSQGGYETARRVGKKDAPRDEEEYGKEQELEETWALTKMPPPFMPPTMGNLWTPVSHVSWPSSISDSAGSFRTQSTSTGTTSVSATLIPDALGPQRLEAETYIAWPEKENDHCLFHEHDYVGLPCFRQTAKWDVDEQTMRYA